MSTARAPGVRPPLECIAYVSSASGHLTDADLEGLLASARRRNEERGVTGALLFDEGSFFQYLEGPREGLEEVYGHIQRSKLHRGIIELERTQVPERQFPRWMMGFTRTPTSSILRLANASWHATVHGAPAAAQARANGMELLLSIWRRQGSSP